MVRASVLPNETLGELLMRAGHELLPLAFGLRAKMYARRL